MAPSSVETITATFTLADWQQLTLAATNRAELIGDRALGQLAFDMETVEEYPGRSSSSAYDLTTPSEILERKADDGD